VFEIASGHVAHKCWESESMYLDEGSATEGRGPVREFTPGKNWSKSCIFMRCI